MPFDFPLHVPEYRLSNSNSLIDSVVYSQGLSILRLLQSHPKVDKRIAVQVLLLLLLSGHCAVVCESHSVSKSYFLFLCFIMSSNMYQVFVQGEEAGPSVFL